MLFLFFGFPALYWRPSLGCQQQDSNREPLSLSSTLPCQSPLMLYGKLSSSQVKKISTSIPQYLFRGKGSRLMRKTGGWKGEKDGRDEWWEGEVRALCPQRESWKQARDKPHCRRPKHFPLLQNKWFRARELDWSTFTYRTTKNRFHIHFKMCWEIQYDSKYTRNGRKIHLKIWHLFKIWMNYR